jgi:phosphoenolpyruvate---glycerone phosphotransferase subunit DhaM
MADAATVGLVLFSHSRSIAEGVAELAAQVGADDVRIAGVGGTEDGRLGTDLQGLATAVEKVAAGAGVVVIPDLGSSVLTARTYLAEGADLPDRVVIADAPLVEGAVAAAVAAASGASLEAVRAAAEEARHVRKL